MVQALLSYQERLREILISKLGWGQHDVIRTFPYSLPLCQLSARPLPGQLTTSAAGLDITATYPIRLLANRINPHDSCSIQTKLDMQLFFNIISDVFGLVDPKIIDGFHVSLISLKRKVRPCDIELLNKNLQESLARNSRAFSFVASITNLSLHMEENQSPHCISSFISHASFNFCRCVKVTLITNRILI